MIFLLCFLAREPYKSLPHSELLIKADVTWPWVQSVSSMAEDWQISGNKFFWGCPGRTGPEGSLGLKNPRDTISWAWDQLKFSARTFHAARAAGLKNLHKFINNMRIKHRTEEWKAPPFSSENIWCFPPIQLKRSLGQMCEKYTKLSKTF